MAHPLMKVPHALVDEAEDISAQDFFGKHVRRNVPIVVRGAAREWLRPSDWTPEGLIAAAEDRAIASYQMPLAQKVINLPDTKQGSLPMHEFLRQCKEEKEFATGKEIYSGAIDIRPTDGFMENFGQLRFLGGLVPHSHTMFLGCNSLCMPHYHHRNQAALTQMSGEKTIFMISPATVGRLPFYPWWSDSHFRCSANVHMEDVVDQIDWAPIDLFRVDLQEGDALYIPVQWFHLPVSSNWSASLTAWWTSRIREWRFPQPGLRALGATVGDSLRSYVQRLRGGGASPTPPAKQSEQVAG